MFTRILFCAVLLALVAGRTPAAEVAADPGSAGLRLATFDIDVTPPIGSHMAYDPVTNVWDLTLRARGLVLLGVEKPIVLCAVDWIGIANEGHDAFRNALAEAAGTEPGRVAIHTLHQHDAPDCDFGAEQVLNEAKIDALNYNGDFPRQVIGRLKKAVQESLEHAKPITHLGLGKAEVFKVASNRRVPGTNGTIRTRYTATKDPALRAEPEGTIDPMLTLISFWNGTQAVALVSHYATHPQSYYRTGVPNPDFPGVARFFRQLALPTALHVHFNGAGGNVGAGKYNDGAPQNRLILAERVADGMKRALESTKLEPITAAEVKWAVEPVTLPPAKDLALETLQAQLKGRDASFFLQGGSSKIAWLRRCQTGHKIDISCLTLGRARIVHLPGEPFVEYQLAAKAMRPDLFVAVAGYGDYGPGYIGTAIAYEEGGYETTKGASNVAPEVEGVLMAAIKKLLDRKP